MIVVRMTGLGWVILESEVDDISGKLTKRLSVRVWEIQNRVSSDRKVLGGYQSDGILS